VIAVGSLIALMLGLAVAYPLIVSDFPSMSKLDISVDVAYFFIQPLNSPSNLTGLSCINSTVDVTYSGGLPGGRLKADGLVVSYLLVLNVTNNSNESVRMSNLQAIIGSNISVGSGGSVSAANPLIVDSRQTSGFYYGFWSPNSYRLIGLSGVAGIHETSYAAMNATMIYLYANAEGQVADTNSGQVAGGYGFKQVQLQTLSGGYLYNTLLNENQILLFYNGLDMSIGTRD